MNANPLAAAVAPLAAPFAVAVRAEAGAPCECQRSPVTVRVTFTPFPGRLPCERSVFPASWFDETYLVAAGR